MQHPFRLTHPRTRFGILLLIILVPFADCLAQTSHKSLNFLYSIRGSQTIGGMHNRQPNANPNSYSQQLHNVVGQWPGLYSADFQFEPNEIANRQTMTNQVITEWNNGAMINLMWHACNPAKGEPCGWDGNGVLSQMSDWEWNQLTTNGTAINNAWKSRMDDVAYYLQQLEDAGVEVFFRPLHEMNQGMFWWGGRPGPNGTAKLYQITHDYFTYTKGLSNLIWVWNLQDFSSLSSDLNSYDPGGSYWDVLTMDMYWSDGQGYTTAKYNALVNKAGGKPIGIGECQDLPAVNVLNAQPLWTFFMGWSELTFQHNSNQKIQDIYWSGRVLTLNEMPGWDNVTTPPSGGTQYIQAENYANMSGVQTESTSDESGGQNVGWIDAGDWMSYSNINVPASGTYTIAYRVASQNGGGSLQLEQGGGGQVYGTINIPSTGGWQTWTTIYQTVNLNAGTQNFGIKALNGGWNFNWWAIIPSNNRVVAPAPAQGTLAPHQPFPNPFVRDVTIPVQVPKGVFRLEIYDLSGRQVRTFGTKELPSAATHVSWNGTDRQGQEVPDGVYFYRMTAGQETTTGKLLKGH
ncbi:Por secretion system C-terminal sorting domain-containing protein [Catalinimonas alkaloidigena]|uniref:Por secretion system C-terminal sorting domain-containing protein n=1 Tax=Catalinimonas alkaloidigena TaxID=1075417 RepID=A0A1G8XH32_9BACT|nr:carbohydrate-binding protein [Catalinimonas alkaloidigena]SDJ89811.1 Por secretion system C-terminal sorting domain-containing protein [Catalinimonas alkaloidigena]